MKLQTKIIEVELDYGIVFIDEILKAFSIDPNQAFEITTDGRALILKPIEPNLEAKNFKQIKD